MKGGQVIWIWMKWTRQREKIVGNRHMISNDSDRVYWILALTSWKAWKRPNLPSQFNPSPMYPGLQVQLYEPWVLVQEALWWQTFILHSSMSGRQKTYIAQNGKLQEICQMSIVSLKKTHIYVTSSVDKDSYPFHNVLPRIQEDISIDILWV